MVDDEAGEVEGLKGEPASVDMPREISVHTEQEEEHH